MNLVNIILSLGSLGVAEIILLGIILLPFISLWKIFEKAGEPGWQAIIPIYNLAVIMKIVNKPWWWALLALIPYLGFIWTIWGLNLLVKRFGKSEFFTAGLVILWFIFFPILAFGDAKFIKNPNHQ